jgi:hypothetical protein
MPQTTYLPLFRASYPILAPAQKPGGVTVSTVLPPTATPNESYPAQQPAAAAAKAHNNGKSKK